MNYFLNIGNQVTGIVAGIATICTAFAASCFFLLKTAEEADSNSKSTETSDVSSVEQEIPKSQIETELGDTGSAELLVSRSQNVEQTKNAATQIGLPTDTTRKWQQSEEAIDNNNSAFVEAVGTINRRNSPNISDSPNKNEYPWMKPGKKSSGKGRSMVQDPSKDNRKTQKPITKFRAGEVEAGKHDPKWLFEKNAKWELEFLFPPDSIVNSRKDDSSRQISRNIPEGAKSLVLVLRQELPQGFNGEYMGVAHCKNANGDATSMEIGLWPDRLRVLFSGEARDNKVPFNVRRPDVSAIGLHIITLPDGTGKLFAWRNKSYLGEIGLEKDLMKEIRKWNTFSVGGNAKERHREINRGVNTVFWAKDVPKEFDYKELFDWLAKNYQAKQKEIAKFNKEKARQKK